MADVKYFKLDSPLTIQISEDEKIIGEPGQYVLTESTGLLSICNDDKLQENIDRISKAIDDRDAKIAEEAAAAQQEETPAPEPTQAE